MSAVSLRNAEQHHFVCHAHEPRKLFSQACVLLLLLQLQLLQHIFWQACRW
jgi:hypothetical protein